MVELHCERGGVEQDGGKDGVFTEGRGGKRPQAILERVLWNVSPDRLGIEGVLYAVTLQKISSVFAKNIISFCKNIVSFCKSFFNLTWFLSKAQSWKDASPSLWKVTITKPTKMLIMKKAMMIRYTK